MLWLEQEAWVMDAREFPCEQQARVAFDAIGGARLLLRPTGEEAAAAGEPDALSRLRKTRAGPELDPWEEPNRTGPSSQPVTPHGPNREPEEEHLAEWKLWDERGGSVGLEEFFTRDDAMAAFHASKGGAVLRDPLGSECAAKGPPKVICRLRDAISGRALDSGDLRPTFELWMFKLQGVKTSNFTSEEAARAVFASQQGVPRILFAGDGTELDCNGGISPPTLGHLRQERRARDRREAAQVGAGVAPSATVDVPRGAGVVGEVPGGARCRDFSATFKEARTRVVPALPPRKRWMLEVLTGTDDAFESFLHRCIPPHGSRGECPECRRNLDPGFCAISRRVRVCGLCTRSCCRQCTTRLEFKGASFRACSGCNHFFELHRPPDLQLQRIIDAERQLAGMVRSLGVISSQIAADRHLEGPLREILNQLVAGKAAITRLCRELRPGRRRSAVENMLKLANGAWGRYRVYAIAPSGVVMEPQSQSAAEKARDPVKPRAVAKDAGKAPPRKSADHFATVPSLGGADAAVQPPRFSTNVPGNTLLNAKNVDLQTQGDATPSGSRDL